MDFQNLDITLSNENIEADAQMILKILRPDWGREDTVFQKLCSGFINQTYKCRQRSDVTLDDALVIRVNGAASLQFGASREREIRTLRLLNTRGSGAPLYASFNNGIVMGNVEGETLTDTEMREPNISYLIAKEIARTHAATPVDIEASLGSFEEFKDPFIMVKSALSNLPEEYADPELNKRYQKNLPYQEIRQEILEQIKHLSKLKLTKALCHNDLWSGNILYNKETDQVRFIDWEECGYTLAAFDIGIHFVWIAGVPAEEKYTARPEFKKRFIRDYLEEINRIKSSTNGNKNWTVTEQDIETFYKETCKCELLSLLFLVLMLVEMNVDENVNVSFSSYDYMGHAEYCWEQYKLHKDEYWN